MENKSKMLKDIRDLCRLGKLSQARKYIDEYNLKYPEDVSSIATEAKVSFYEENFDRAGELFKRNLELSNDYKKEFTQLNYIYYLLEIKDYKRAYFIVNSIDFDKLLEKDYASYVRVLLCKAFLEKQLFKKVLSVDLDTYLYHQIVNYDVKEAFLHVYSRHNSMIDSKASSFKMEHNELRNLFYMTREKLKTAKKTLNLDFPDHYYFKSSDYCNRDLLFTVVTLKHSNEIITMYPVYSSSVNSKIVNDFDIGNDYTSSKVRVRTSQIDKFKNKYGMK